MPGSVGFSIPDPDPALFSSDLWEALRALSFMEGPGGGPGYRFQSGARFSTNAATPSAVSSRIMFSAITVPAWA